ncbi:MAG: AmmeMemoRadiSam system protein A [Polyangiaceae bacterium]|nr:AmmeMemoRadiSam system protein A [Polyangiaceae bacterium]
MLGESQGQKLVTMARDAIAAELGLLPAGAPPGSDDAWLLERAATFVTLHRAGRLHGCIGSIEARRSLSSDVRHNAVAAAFHDPRATPLRPADLGDLHVEVSLLSPLEPMTFRDEADALAQLRPFRDGVVFSCGGARATFLPQVWESLPDPREFMAHLKQKAGFPADFWSSAVRLDRYSLQKWSDDDLPSSTRSTRPPARSERA